MASSLVSKARKEIISLRDRSKRLAQRRKEEAQEVTRGAATLAGAALAALIDEKMGEGGEVAEIGNIPTNAIVGGATVAAAALVKGMPFRKELASAGLGMASVSVYQLVRDNVDFES